MINLTRPSPNFSPRLRDKVWAEAWERGYFKTSCVERESLCVYECVCLWQQTRRHTHRGKYRSYPSAAHARQEFTKSILQDVPEFPCRLHYYSMKVQFIHPETVLNVASFPDLPHLQFLIACGMQNRGGRPGESSHVIHGTTVIHRHASYQQPESCMRPSCILRYLRRWDKRQLRATPSV